MTVRAQVGGDRGRSPLWQPTVPAYLFEPSFVREQIAERVEADLQDAEAWDAQARILEGTDE